MRRGELDGHLAIHDGLRDEVLHRYQQVLVSDVDSCDNATVQQVLATYAAIGPIAATDQDCVDRIADFVGLPPHRLRSLVFQLKARDVLVGGGVSVRVTPDILADQILERETVVDGQDTGFAAEVWTAFGTTRGDRLLQTLFDLDWRLTVRGGPRVVNPLLAEISTAIHVVDFASLAALLARLTRLSFTHPTVFVGLLDTVRARIDQCRAAAATDRASGQTCAQPNDPTCGRGSDEALVDMEARLPKLHGECAINAPDLLERVLDALWALHRCTVSSVRRESAAEIVSDKLANFGSLPDPTFPDRIVSRVERWLTEPARPTDNGTPLFALKSLLAKEGARTSLVGPRQLSFDPTSWMRPVCARCATDAE